MLINCDRRVLIRLATGVFKVQISQNVCIADIFSSVRISLNFTYSWSPVWLAWIQYLSSVHTNYYYIFSCLVESNPVSQIGLCSDDTAPYEWWRSECSLLNAWWLNDWMTDLHRWWCCWIFAPKCRGWSWSGQGLNLETNRKYKNNNNKWGNLDSQVVLYSTLTMGPGLWVCT